jgi:hypothetical protein
MGARWRGCISAKQQRQVTNRGSAVAGVLMSLDWQSTTPPRLTGRHGLMKSIAIGLVE